MASVLKRKKIGIACIVLLTIFYAVGMLSIKRFFAVTSGEASRNAAEQAVYIALFNEEKDVSWRSALQTLQKSQEEFDIAIYAQLLGVQSGSTSLTEAESHALARLRGLLQNPGKGLPDQKADELMEELLSVETPPVLDTVSYAAILRAGRMQKEYLATHHKYYNGIKQLAIRLHQQGFLDLALNTFDVLLQLEFVDPELLAWKGSALCKRALFVTSPLEKMALVSEGATVMDTVVYDYPNFLVVRYVRANTYQNLPSIFKKEAMLAEDLGYLISAFLEKREVQMVVDYNTIATKTDMDIEPLRKLVRNNQHVIEKIPDLRDKAKTIDSDKP